MIDDKLAGGNKTVTLHNVRMPMRDGVELEADITFPSADGATPMPGTFSTLLLRTPYGRKAVSAFPCGVVASAAVISPTVGAEHDYVVIYQDVRGTYEADGVLEPMLNEAPDGIDTLAWIRSQPWSDGRICMFGPSYMGAVQMLLAAEAPEGLTAICSHVAATDQFKHNWAYFDDVFSFEVAVVWSLMQSVGQLVRQPEHVKQAMIADLQTLTGMSVDLEGANFSRSPAFAVATRKLLTMTPVYDLPLLRHLPWWRQWLDNRHNPNHFKANEMKDRFAGFGVPALHVGGWYDLFLRNTISHFVGITNEARDAEVAAAQRLVIGPWSHSDCVNCPPGGAVDGQAMDLAWIDQHIRGEKHPFFDHRIALYIQGENRWRAEESWPLDGTVKTRYYLHSGGSANTADGDGVLSTKCPGAETPDTYRYDPADPVPSKGGITLIGSRATQNEMEARADVLCYTTAVLTEDVEVTGDVSAILYAATSATDTDWWMRLIDVAPDGTASTLNHGVVRARYRNSRTSPEAVTPGAVTQYKIAMQATSNVFKQGHRIRLEVSSSCFPLGERNPNAFIDLATVTEADFIVAEQIIFHDADRASYVELPIIPLERARHWMETPFPLPSGQHVSLSMPTNT